MNSFSISNYNINTNEQSLVPVIGSNVPVTGSKRPNSEITGEEPKSKKYKEDSVELRVEELWQAIEMKLIEVSEINAEIKLYKIILPNSSGTEMKVNQLQQELENKVEELCDLKNEMKMIELPKAILCLEEDSQFLISENNAFKDSIKKIILPMIKDIKCVNDFRNIQNITLEMTERDDALDPKAMQKMCLEVFNEPEVDPISFTFEAIGESITVTLPLSLWRAHSLVFENSAKSPMKKTNFQEDTSPEVLRMFILALKQCTSTEALSLDNLQDIWELADKYQILWLSEECAQFFEEVYKPIQTLNQEVENLISAYKFRQVLPVSSSMVNLCKIWKKLKDKAPDEVKDSVKKILLELADNYQLVELKLFMNFDHVKIRPDCTFSLTFKRFRDEFEIKKKFLECLDVKDSWYPHKIELSGRNFDISMAILEIMDKINENESVIYNLQYGNFLNDHVSNFTQRMRHLRLTLDCFHLTLESVNDVLKVIEKNTSLKTLCLIINNYHDINDDGLENVVVHWPKIEYTEIPDVSAYFPDNSEDSEDEDSEDTINNKILCTRKYEELYAAENQIKNALEVNDKFRAENSIEPLKLRFIQSNGTVDEASTYTKNFIPAPQKFFKNLSTQNSYAFEKILR